MSWRQRLGDIQRAAADLGLAPRPITWWEVPADRLYAIAAAGIPGHYPHWTLGRDYERYRTAHQRGHRVIYELVCNLDPAQAYLLDENSDPEQLFVAAHVMGHVDLFGRNVFSQQQRLDMDQVLHAATLRFAAYEDEYGLDAVERTIDAAHMLRWHAVPEEMADPKAPQDPGRDPYDAIFPGAAGDPAAGQRQWKEHLRRHRQGVGERDLLRFLVRHAPLEEWQRDVLSVVRELALYFLPQMQTKILHEGYASWAHRRILRQIRGPRESTVSDARLHAGIAGTPDAGGLNPYWLGLLILEHLERRGETVPEVVRWESDRSLIGRLDAELYAESEVLQSIEVDVPQGQAKWEVLRDLFAGFVPQVPEVEVRVQAIDGPLTLAADLPVDPGYAHPVLNMLATIWGAPVELRSPSQTLKSGEG
jgi:stage V sporulation protein R